MSDKNLSIVVRLKDQISSPLKRIKKQAQEIEKAVTKKKKVNVDTSQATKNLNKASQAAKKTKKEINSIKSKPVTLTAKDRATSVINKVKGKLKGISRVPAIAINAKDKMSSTIGKLKGKLKALAVVAGAIVISGKLVLDYMIKPGAELASQKVSMTHFMGGDQKGSDKYLQALRKEADRTPFGSQEVVQAGTRAIGLTSGNTSQAMELVKMSEDMASLTPGKTVMDAMEAIADALHKKISHIGRLLNKSLKKTGTLRSRSEVKFSFKKLNSRNA